MQQLTLPGVALPTTEERIAAALEEVREIRLAKNHDYGDSWRRLGLIGVFVRLSDKFFRLESLLWRKRNAQVKTESLRDTLVDMLNYVLFAVVLLEEGNFDGSPVHA